MRISTALEGGRNIFTGFQPWAILPVRDFERAAGAAATSVEYSMLAFLHSCRDTQFNTLTILPPR
jgi:hypothetical protein